MKDTELKLSMDLFRTWNLQVNDKIVSFWLPCCTGTFDLSNSKIIEFSELAIDEDEYQEKDPGCCPIVEFWKDHNLTLDPEYDWVTEAYLVSFPLDKIVEAKQEIIILFQEAESELGSFSDEDEDMHTQNVSLIKAFFAALSAEKECFRIL